MDAIYITIIVILVVIVGILAFLILKSKKPIIGKATIPPTVQESQIMEMLGEATIKLDEYKKLLEKYQKEKEIKINVTDEIRRKAILEKKRIIKEGVILDAGTYKIVGIDGSNYGDLKAIVLSSDGEKAWIYYQKDKIIDIVGGKPLQNIIKHIDKKQKILFIQYNKDKKLIPKQYEII